MQFEPLNTQRTEWQIKNLEELFDKVLPLFPQLLEEDISEIKKYIQTENIDYLEIAHYKNAALSQKNPTSILVINRNKVFYDIVDLDFQEELIENFKSLTAGSGKFVKSRPITLDELKKRIMVFLQDHDMSEFGGKELLSDLEDSGDLGVSGESVDSTMPAEFDENDELNESEQSDEFENSDEDSEEGIFDFIEKDASGHLDRAPIRVIAKQPVLNWLNQSLAKEPPSKIPLAEFKWTLEKINEEATVFLIPVATELLPKKASLKFWRETKQRIFFEFVQGYYVDEDYWPTYAGEAMFDQWFEIEMLGMVIDLVE